MPLFLVKMRPYSPCLQKEGAKVIAVSDSGSKFRISDWWTLFLKESEPAPLEGEPLQETLVHGSILHSHPWPPERNLWIPFSLRNTEHLSLRSVGPRGHSVSDNQARRADPF